VKMFDVKQIRDTNAHYSSVYKRQVESKAVIKLTIVYKNTHDQDCTLTIEASVDEAFTDPVSDFTNNPFTASANMSSPLHHTLSDYFPYLRVKAQCGTGPSSGQLDVWILP